MFLSKHLESSCSQAQHIRPSAHPRNDLQVKLRKPRRLPEIVVSENRVMPPLVSLPRRKRRTNPDLVLEQNNK